MPQSTTAMSMDSCDSGYGSDRSLCTVASSKAPTDHTAHHQCSSCSSIQEQSSSPSCDCTDVDHVLEREMSRNERRARDTVRHAVRHNPIFSTTYRITSIVGFGSNGCVVAATHVDGASVAIKCIPRRTSARWMSLASCHEAIVARCLPPHDRLLGLLDSFEDERNIYLVTRLVTNERIAPHHDATVPLVFWARGALHRIPVSEGRSDLHSWVQADDIQPSSARSMFAQVVDALGHMHDAGLMHGDVKGENILVGAGGDVYLCDMGHARDRTLVRTYGTAEMAAPELDTGAGGCGVTDGHAADVYALGCVLLAVLRRGRDVIAPPRTREELDVLLGRCDDAEESLRGLFRGCLASSAIDRWSCAQIRACAWLQGL